MADEAIKKGRCVAGQRGQVAKRDSGVRTGRLVNQRIRQVGRVERGPSALPDTLLALPFQQDISF